MATRLIFRGAHVDYVNNFGKTAMHVCVESGTAMHVCVEFGKTEQVQYLLFKGANPHIMDLTGLDACDKAKANGMANVIHEFINCNMRKKVVPRLPDGTYANIDFDEVY
eukprot:CAMPEP_0170510590 /NCGR_PEP_ID=MMETSP0208-20121228/65850_1 /TAXON_ID=197538 /ORGANISM="Strombidium inclinatum, Strain S3" /LENGTH=108 /DNA_ID=CAMNT_0010794069 /DNA_START=1299 /DNA_END=1625 /DNA_ORIENTATION=+